MGEYSTTVIEEACNSKSFLNVDHIFRLIEEGSANIKGIS